MNQDQRLSEVLREFARTLATDFDIQTLLDHLVQQIVVVLPIDSAGVTLISPETDPQYVSASDDAALRYEKLQTELGEGPCTAAYTTGESVLIEDLSTDDRFPKFTEKALAEGLEACFTFPLHHGDVRLGALDLYRDSRGPLSAESIESAQTLADVAAAYLINARARDDLTASAERAREVSLHDGLTGLPNRTLLMQRIEHAAARCRRSKKLVAILFTDLDNFKSINDTFGHHVGDELLICVAERLTHLLRPGDTLARLSGDEFVILCEDLDDASQASQIAKRIGSGLVDGFVLSVGRVQVTASVGIAFTGVGEDVPLQVLREADSAMYQAKRRGGGTHGIMDLRERHEADHRAGLVRDLPFALARGELRNDYQPIVATRDGRVIGTEALLRWDHPTRGVISPVIAVALAEQAGLIAEIGTWILRRACEDRRSWQPDGLRAHAPGISVNVSVQQLMTPGFAESVKAVLSETQTEPDMVTLEITESVFIQDSKRALIVLRQLQEIGVTIALDDFGTGYASLSHLKQYPINIVKIDRSFISGIEHTPADRLIVASVVALAHGLSMRVAAEGVENRAQLEQVVALDCDTVQGFYFARPASTVDLDKQLAGGFTGMMVRRAVPAQRSERDR